MYTFKDFEDGKIQVDFIGVSDFDKKEFYRMLEDKGYKWASGTAPTQYQNRYVYCFSNKKLKFCDPPEVLKNVVTVQYYKIDIPEFREDKEARVKDFYDMMGF